jgi:hypothetical protein
MLQKVLTFCITLCTVSLIAAAHTRVEHKKLTITSGGIFEDSIFLDPDDWQNMTVSFAFTIQKDGNPDTYTSALETGIKKVSMDPGCETNLEKFAYVSKLEFLNHADIGWLKITMKPSGPHNAEISVDYHFTGIPDHPTVKSSRKNSDRSCTCPLPDYVPRAEWGIAYNLNNDIYRPPATYTDVSHLIVHHSATANQSNNWPAVVASIFNYHANTNQWQDIGYNWLIDPEGNLYQGRGGGNDVRGAHMCGYNNQTMGVCILGTYTSSEPDTRALKTLEALLSYKACQKNIDPTGSDSIVSHTGFMKHISGHRDGCAPNYTECPGNKLHAFLPLLRESCVTYIQDSCEIFSDTETVVRPSEPEILAFHNGFVKIVSPSEYSILITDISGKLLENSRMLAGEQTFYLEHLAPGFYIITVSVQQKLFTRKWVKI